MLIDRQTNILNKILSVFAQITGGKVYTMQLKTAAEPSPQRKYDQLLYNAAQKLTFKNIMLAAEIC